MSRFWTDRVRALEPYVPGEQPKAADLVKLNTNENPFPPSPRVIEAIREAAGDSLRLYPPPEADALKGVIADYHDLAPDQVFVGNGSDEVLAHCFQAFFAGGGDILFPDITYSFYPVYCRLYDVGCRRVPLAKDFTIDPADYRGDNAGIIFPNPNAPTGCLLGLETIEGVLRDNSDSLLVVDEAYIDFGGDSAAALVERYSNLLVVQTLSKSRSLAGLRVGFALGHRELIEGLNRVKNSFNSYPLDNLAIAGAIASFKDETYFRECRRAVMETREALAGALTARGFSVLPSAANFLFARHPDFTGDSLAEGLRQQGVIVRHFRQPRIEPFVRITVGSDHQHKRLLTALDHLLVR